MPRLLQLTELSALADDDFLYVVDASAPSGKSKRVSLDTLREYNRGNPYCFRAFDSGGTTLTDGATVQINLGTEEYDYNGNFAASSYTAPFDGVYHFDGGVVSTTIATPINSVIYIYKNGVQAIHGFNIVPVNGSIIAMNISGDLHLEAGDVITLRFFQNTAGGESTITGSSNTWFSGHLVHRD